jgi:hypothetical protein
MVALRHNAAARRTDGARCRCADHHVITRAPGMSGQPVNTRTPRASGRYHVVDPLRTEATPMTDSADARAFDFWIGEWEVRDADGTVAGHNRIEAILGGAALRESWTGVSGHVGTSLNAWDPDRGVWRQAWVDVNGFWLLLEGELRDGAMVLEGDRPKRGDPTRTVRHRIVWSVVDGDPDRVRQHWEFSEDGGVTWATLFDG